MTKLPPETIVLFPNNVYVKFEHRPVLASENGWNVASPSNDDEYPFDEDHMYGCMPGEIGWRGPSEYPQSKVVSYWKKPRRKR